MPVIVIQYLSRTLDLSESWWRATIDVRFYFRVAQSNALCTDRGSEEAKRLDEREPSKAFLNLADVDFDDGPHCCEITEMFTSHFCPQWSAPSSSQDRCFVMQSLLDEEASCAVQALPKPQDAGCLKRCRQLSDTVFSFPCRTPYGLMSLGPRNSTAPLDFLVLLHAATKYSSDQPRHKDTRHTMQIASSAGTRRYPCRACPGRNMISGQDYLCRCSSTARWLTTS